MINIQKCKLQHLVDQVGGLMVTVKYGLTLLMIMYIGICIKLVTEWLNLLIYFLKQMIYYKKELLINVHVNYY